MNYFDQFWMRTVDAIVTLIQANHYQQALVVLYAEIDTLSWVNLEEGDVSRKDFCNWVSKYLKPEVNLGCTAEDLYAARCALLHSGTAESKMSSESPLVP